MQITEFEVFYDNKPFGFERLVNSNWEFMCPDLNPTGAERWVKGVFTSNALDADKFIRRLFTGLVDKNGKKIYEGDIVTWDGLRANKQVVFKNGSFRVANSKRTSGFKDNLLNKQRIYHLNLVVIGNIYQNFSLLKEIDYLKKQKQ